MSDKINTLHYYSLINKINPFSFNLYIFFNPQKKVGTSTKLHILQ